MTTFGTCVQYGDVVLKNCLTKSFRQTVVYDRSETDKLFTRFSISVETHVHEEDDDLRNVFGIGFAGMNTANAMDFLHRYLSTPRRFFRYSVEGNPVLTVRSVPSDSVASATEDFFLDLDLDNGPKPRDISIVHVAGYHSFRIVFSIDVAVAKCAEYFTYWYDSSPPPLAQEQLRVISNKWSVREYRDKNFFMTRHISGTCRVGHASLWPSSVRYLVIPPQTLGYQCTGMDFVQSPDGLSLDYSVTYQQRHAAPPWPAVDWKAQHVEETGIGGAKGSGVISMTLFGAPGTSKKSLLLAGISVIEARIGPSPAQPSEVSNFWVTKAVLADPVDENAISMTVAVDRTYPANVHKGTEQRTWLNLVWDNLDVLPGVKPEDPNREPGTSSYNRDQWPSPLPYDSNTPYGVFATYWQSACHPQHGMVNPTALQPEGEMPAPDTQSQSPSVRAWEGETSRENDDVQAQEQQTVDESQKSFGVTDIEIEPRYIKKTGRILIPYASPETNAQGRIITGVVATLHQPYTIKSIWYRATRLGKYPIFPTLRESFEDELGITYTLLESEFLPYPPQLSPDGRLYLYKLELRLDYAMNSNFEQGDSIPTASLPWDTTDLAANVLALSDETQSIQMV